MTLCQIPQTLVDRRPRQTRRPRHRRDAAVPELSGFYGRPKTTFSLVEELAQEREFLTNRLCGSRIHAPIMSTLKQLIQVICRQPLSVEAVLVRRPRGRTKSGL
jgi:hypothetical protein